MLNRDAVVLVVVEEVSLVAVNPLTPKQDLFVMEYVVDLNGKQAAIRAGYSARTAEVQASRLLSHVKVQEAVQRAQESLLARVAVTQEDVIRELAQIAFSDMGSYAKWGPDGIDLKESDKLPEGATRVVAEVSQTVTKDGGSVKFRLHNKLEALEKLGKHLGLFIDRHEVSGTVKHVLEGVPPEKLRAMADVYEVLEAKVVEGEVVEEKDGR